MKLRIHQKAHAEAVGGAAYYESQRSELGGAFLELVQDAFRQIEQHPRRFAKLETTQLEGEIRRCLLRKFPYVIIYEVRSDLIEVLAVAHASRMPDYWADRRQQH